MNDPITLSATQHESSRGTPDNTAPDAPDAPDAPPEPAAPDRAVAPAGPDVPDDSDAPSTLRMRTLLETAATCRPVEEVTALVGLLKEDGRLPDAGQEALRAAAVTRPVQDVERMVTLLGDAPQEVGEADMTLRAAAVGRSIEDVALLVNILGRDAPGEPEQQNRARPAEAPAPAAEPHPAPTPGPYAKPHEPTYREPYDAPRRAKPRPPAPVPAPAGSAARGHALRWPVAIALLVSGALHLPQDLTALSSAGPLGLLPLLVTLACLAVGALVALRDTTAVWRAGAATAVGVVALHVLGGSLAFDPLAGTVGGGLAWAGAAVMLCAAAGAVLAGLALRNRQEASA
ncbi:hypothetical protein [Streptomyces sp. NPDC058874]|uniref:hypothetical protein n=1 Tax=unclassified Streptomyces TaxID=2593676 RepID=UPI003688E63C